MIATAPPSAWKAALGGFFIGAIILLVIIIILANVLPAPAPPAPMMSPAPAPGPVSSPSSVGGAPYASQ